MKNLTLTCLVLMLYCSMGAQDLQLQIGMNLSPIRGSGVSLLTPGVTAGLQVESGSDNLSAIFGAYYSGRSGRDTCLRIRRLSLAEVYLGAGRQVYSVDGCKVWMGAGWNVVIPGRSWGLPGGFDQEADFGPYASVAFRIGKSELAFRSLWGTSSWVPSGYLVTVGYVFSLRR